MKNTSALLILVTLGAVTPVLAADPPQAATEAVAAAAATPATPAAAPAAASAAATASDDEARAKATDKRLRGQGYKPVVRKGATLYCRNETAIGSRFPTQVCGTPDDLDRAAQNAKDTTDKIQRDVTQPKSN